MLYMVRISIAVCGCHCRGVGSSVRSGAAREGFLLGGVKVASELERGAALDLFLPARSESRRKNSEILLFHVFEQSFRSMCTHSLFACVGYDYIGSPIDFKYVVSVSQKDTTIIIRIIQNDRPRYTSSINMEGSFCSKTYNLVLYSDDDR